MVGSYCLYFGLQPYFLESAPGRKPSSNIDESQKNNPFERDSQRHRMLDVFSERPHPHARSVAKAATLETRTSYCWSR